MIPIFLFFFYHGERVVWYGVGLCYVMSCQDGVFVAIFMWDERRFFEAKCWPGKSGFFFRGQR